MSPIAEVLDPSNGRALFESRPFFESKATLVLDREASRSSVVCTTLSGGDPGQSLEARWAQNSVLPECPSFQASLPEGEWISGVKAERKRLASKCSNGPEGSEKPDASTAFSRIVPRRYRCSLPSPAEYQILYCFTAVRKTPTASCFCQASWRGRKAVGVHRAAVRAAWLLRFGEGGCRAG